MKKIIIYLFISSLFLPYTNKVFSYGIDFDGSSFYTSISDSVEELDSKLYTIELAGEKGTAEKIKKISGVDCLKGNLTEKEVKEISLGNYEVLIKKIKKECRENGDLSNNLILRLVNSVIELDMEAYINAKSKANKIQEISKIGIYSDGITENSPFDLMKDIELIDEIIFEKIEKYDYKGDKNLDIAKKLSSEIEEKLDNLRDIENLSNIELILCKINGRCDKKSELEEFKCEKLGDCEEKVGEFYEIIKSEDVCKVDKSGLKKSTERIIEVEIGKKTNSEGLVTELVNELLKGEKNKTSSGSSKKTTIAKDLKPIGSYNEVNDNSFFPCYTFFCINISFDKYNHNLLGGWEGTSPSIEFLIKRSNEHLKKFTNTSLVQAKMSLNNFELGLKDINLSDMFRMSVIISDKPVPIFDLNKDFKNGGDKEGLDEEKFFSLENQLKVYYENNGLDYKRQNDLSIFSGIDIERKTFNVSGFGSVRSAYGRINQYEKYFKGKRKKTDTLREAIKEKTKTSIISDLEKQFKELEVFTKSTSDYVENLDVLLDNMLKIPIDSGQS